MVAFKVWITGYFPQLIACLACTLWCYVTRLEKALGVSEAIGIRLVPMHCLGILGVV
jgi:hypothetical protein